ncbi:MAG: DNA polymerase Y family protein [Burkholderiales bacterium]
MPPLPLRTLFVDFNSYFASVEQQMRPELRGLPVAVLPVMADTTCCIAASYEAKKFGIKTGTRVSEAKRLCPEIRLLEARPALYIEYHHKLVEIVESCTPVERVYSIDEMGCELTGSQQKKATALALAQTIKRKISERAGAALRCSIGIAPNTFLAKVASDMQKPDGCVVIEERDLPQCLYHMELRDLSGIGRNMEKRLHACGIHSVQALCKADKASLRQAWGGIEGERFHAKLRGTEVISSSVQRGSVGHSHVLPPQARAHEQAYAILHRLLQKAAMRLRSYNGIAGKMQVRVKYLDGSAWENERRFNPTQDTLRLLKILEQLWQDYRETKPVPLAVAVTLLELDEQAHQSRSLFDSGSNRDKLNAVIDSLNLRYGKNTLYFGGAHFALNTAPMRIAFNHIPDPAIESDE